jgi:hypothetical protein
MDAVQCGPPEDLGYRRPRRGCPSAIYRSARALEPLLGYMRGLGAAAQPRPASPAREPLQRFQR